jgi:hypothetical protein
MKNILRISFKALAAMMLVFSTACEKEDPSKFDRGSGTLEDPWLISNARQFNNIRNDLKGSYRLVADIDMKSLTTGSGWEPVGNIEAGFSGTLDGNGHSIRGIVKSGIFRHTAEGSLIKDLVLEFVNITDFPDVPLVSGTLAEYNRGEIINCSVTGIVKGVPDVSFGGLVGLNQGNITDCHVDMDISECGGIGGIAYSNEGKITDCSAAGTFTNNQYSFKAGGICVLNPGTIEESKASVNISGSSSVVSAGGFVTQNTGNITGSFSTGNIDLIIRKDRIWYYFGDMGVGGFAGSSTDNGILRDCYATGNVSTRFDESDYEWFRVLTGGFSGMGGNITNCYAAGKVSGDDSGGLVGGEIEGVDWTRAIVTTSYYNMETTGQDDSGMGIPKTTEEMMQQTTFEGWDFSGIWKIDEDSSYPYLRWQQRP